MPTTQQILNQLDPQELDRLGPLLVRAEQGDPTALPELRQALDQLPELWAHYGDLALHARQAWVDRAAGQNLLLREALDRRLEAVRAELAGPEAPPLERLLAEQVATCWLQSAYADAAAAQARTREALGERKLALQRQESAQRRLLAALKQLAVVRKLPRPEVSPLDVALRGVSEGAAVRGNSAGGRRALWHTAEGVPN